MAQESLAGKTAAPDFPPGLDWLNTDHPIPLADLRGKVVLLDFWTYCCINCIHVIPDLKRLEEKYADELVVIGVHSAKFTTEKGTENIREAILRYGIAHPVVNDRDFEVWRAYAVHAWPSFVIIDPDGKISARHSGEDVYDLFDAFIGALVAEFDAQRRIDRTPTRLALERDRAPRSLFSFPGKLATDAEGRTLFVSDSNHDRIVAISLEEGRVVDVIGGAGSGLTDGLYSEARFNKPQGVAVDGDVLYVADTENHAIRRVDLAERTVRTLAGTGSQARRSNVSGSGKSVELNSPWDLVVHGGRLYVAMAGPHQLWSVDLSTLEARPYAGSGVENIVDGPLREAALAQPSGVTAGGEKLYFVDSEVSAVRSADLDPEGRVETIVGEGLFEYGDRDGVGREVRLQHPLGIEYHEGVLYVADTYNNKIKRIDPRTSRSDTFLGSGRPGMRDGPAREAELNEPNDVVHARGKLYIADTNNHLIRVFDLSTHELSTLTPAGVERLAGLSPEGFCSFAGDSVLAPRRTVGPGSGTIDVSVRFAEGYKINPAAPFYLESESGDPAVVGVADVQRRQSIEGPSFPVRVPAVFAEGQTTVRLTMIVYYCEAVRENLCLFKEVQVLVPVQVSADEDSRTVEVTLEVD